MSSSTSLARSAASLQQQRSVQAYKEPTIASLSNCSPSSLAAGGCRGSPLSCSTTSSSLSLKSHQHNRKGGSTGDSEMTVQTPTPSGGKSNVTAQRLQCFKTKRCRFWMESRCTRWDRCTYAHTDVELRVPPDLTKTKICSRWKRGACEKSAGECAYAHGVDDLRDNPSTPTSPVHSPSSVLSASNVKGPASNVLSANGGQQILLTGKTSSTPVPESSLPLNSHRSTQTIGSTVSTTYTNRKDSISSLHTLDDTDEEEQISTDSSHMEHSDYSTPLPSARQSLTVPFPAAPASTYQQQILLPEPTTTTASTLSCYSIATPSATPYLRTIYPDSSFIWADLLVSLTSPYDD